MKNLVEKQWKELQKKINTEQVFYIIIMLIFSEYYNYKQSRNTPDNFTQQYFNNIFSDIYDYEFRETVSRFSEKVDWFLVEDDRDIQDILQKLREQFSVHFKRNQDEKGVSIERKNGQSTQHSFGAGRTFWKLYCDPIQYSAIN